MPLDLNGIEQSISVVLGGGKAGQLAAGGAAAGFVGQAQDWINQKGSQVGVFLGNLGLSGFLAGAASGANKSTTAQAQSLLGIGSKTAIYVYAIGAGISLLIFKYTKSAIGAVAGLIGTVLIGNVLEPPASVQAPAPPKTASVQPGNLFQSLIGIGGKLIPAPLSTLFNNTAPGEETSAASGLGGGVGGPGISIPTVDFISELPSSSNPLDLAIIQPLTSVSPASAPDAPQPAPAQQELPSNFALINSGLADTAGGFGNA